MSGFVGIFHRDGRPVDGAQLEALTESLRFRGPDGSQTWRRGSIGLGHSRFVTHAARDGEVQPLSLDDRFWIAGHLRLDARDELIAALCHSEPSEESRECSDAALVLHAYRAWGAGCVQRIHGDFSFAIWDEPQRRLFCARDPFGVRPFFYAQFDDLFLFSNTLSSLRQHGRVSDRLYEPAVADYLAAGHLLDLDKTFFADIARLSPGQTLTVEGRHAKAVCYWTLPLEPELRYRNDREYVDQFAHVMSQALADRCLPGPSGLFLSGGLDSAVLATIGAGRLGRTPREQLTAICIASGPRDPEPELARLTSHALGMPLDALDAQQSEPFLGWQRSEGAGPEPDYNPYRSTLLDAARHLARSTRVALNGQGGDEVLWGEYALDEARRTNPVRVARGVVGAWRATGRRPALGLRLALARLFGRAPAPWPATPRWLNTQWIRAMQIPERFQAFADRNRVQPSLPRAAARQRLAAPIWTTYLESHDPGITGVGLETRWPFLDERVVRFALRLRPFPWCVYKHLSRRALQGLLPSEIVRRPKTVVTADPLVSYIESHPDWFRSMQPISGALSAYVDLERWYADCADASRRASDAVLEVWALARVVGLNYWLGHEETGRRPHFSPCFDFDRSSRSPHERQHAQSSRIRANGAEAV